MAGTTDKDAGHSRTSQNQSQYVVSNFSSETNSYETNLVKDNCPRASHLVGGDNYEQSGSSRGKFKIIEDFVYQALCGLSPRTNKFISILFGANLFISILNTLLLSFIVKSVQLNDHGFFGGKIFWQEKLSETVLEIPTSIAIGRYFSVNSIESDQERDLIILNHEHDSGSLDIESSGLTNQMLKVGGRGGIAHTLLSEHKIDGLVADNHRLAMPVEIVAKSLVFNLIEEDSNLSINSNNHVNHYVKQMTASRGGSSSMGNPAHGTEGAGSARDSLISLPMTTRRLFDYDSEQQSITLPLLKRVDLESRSAATASLIVEDNLNLLGSEIHGTLVDNLDIQTRNGDLNCESAESMRLISKSGSLRMVAEQMISFDAPIINMSVASLSNSLRILGQGIECFNSDSKPEKGYSNSEYQSTAFASGGLAQNEAEQLQAYNLFIVGGKLMASS